MRTRVFQIFLIVTSIVMLGSGSAHAAMFKGPLDQQGGASANGTPAEYKDVGLDEHRGSQIPLNATFTDELGKTVTLGDYFKTGKPVIMQLGYFGCPMLCDLVSKGTLDSLKNLDLKLGDDYSIVFVSIDPHETWHDGNLKKQGYVKQFAQPGAAGGWHFLVGSAENVKAISEAVGFRYKWIPVAQQFSHPAAIMLMTADGRISRYLYGVQFPEKTLRLSLVEASENKIGTAMDQFLLVCFHYDVHAGKYTLAAMNLMRIGGAVTVLLLACTLVPFYRREVRRARTGGTNENNESGNNVGSNH
jgi:protein SCO1/2